MEYIEKEFTLQIEKLLKIGLKPSFINSHVHTHAIPEDFKLTCELARKYNIKAIKTQDEIFYIAPDKNHFKISYFINIIKHFLLKIFTLVNKNNAFMVKVDRTDLNIRDGAGTNYKVNSVIPKGIYTIVETKAGQGSTAGWGKLKSGAGWISLDFATRI